MPKKITIVSAAALVLLLAVIMLAVKLSEKRRESSPAPPERVSVLFSEENAIRIIPYNEFLRGCVRGLLPRGIAENPEPETVRAVAIAEHTRALYHLASKTPGEAFGTDFAVCEEFPYTADGADEPLGYFDAKELPVLLYDGETFNVPMCKISAGVTDAAPPYSPSLPLLCDIDAKGALRCDAYTFEDVRRAMGAKTAPPDIAYWFHDPVYTEAGTLVYIGFLNTRVTGAGLRQAIGLASTAITVEFREEKFYFTCRGTGENRGMSVNAANFLAQNGKTAEEILMTFFPDTVIE